MVIFNFLLASFIGIIETEQTQAQTRRNTNPQLEVEFNENVSISTKQRFVVSL